MDALNLFELNILNFIQDKIACPPLDFFFSLITHLGDGGIFWIAIAVILLCFKKTRKTGLIMGIALLLGLLTCNLGLKPLVHRARPFTYVEGIELLIKQPGEYSFPSGHTVGSFEGAIAIFTQNKKWGTAALVVAACVALSRLYLFVHYPTDVLGGIVLATINVLIALFITNLIWKKFPKKSAVEL